MLEGLTRAARALRAWRPAFRLLAVLSLAAFVLLAFMPAAGGDPERAFLALIVALWSLLVDFSIDRFADPPVPTGPGLLARLRFRLARGALYLTALLSLAVLILVAGLTLRAAGLLLGA